MLYQMYLNIMDFLTRNLGYVWAVRVKLLLLILSGGAILTVASILMGSDFFLRVNKNPIMKPNAVIVGPTEDNPNFTANPKNFKDAVEVYIQYLLFRIFHRSDCLWQNENTANGSIKIQQ